MRDLIPMDGGARDGGGESSDRVGAREADSGGGARGGGGEGGGVDGRERQLKACGKKGKLYSLHQGGVAGIDGHPL